MREVSRWDWSTVTTAGEFGTGCGSASSRCSRPDPHPLGCHNPRVPDRDAMNAILLVLRTGMQWNALNATGVYHSSSAHRRFQEWERAGVFHEIWRRGLLDYDEQIGIDWSFLAADAAITKPPPRGARHGLQSHR